MGLAPLIHGGKRSEVLAIGEAVSRAAVPDDLTGDRAVDRSVPAYLSHGGDIEAGQLDGITYGRGEADWVHGIEKCHINGPRLCGFSLAGLLNQPPEIGYAEIAPIRTSWIRGLHCREPIVFYFVLEYQRTTTHIEMQIFDL